MLPFPLLTLALSLLLSLRLRNVDPDEEDRGAVERVVRQVMWAPGIVAIGLTLTAGGDVVALGLGRVGQPGLLLAALLGPLLMEGLLLFAVVRFRLAQLDRSLYRVKDGWVTLSPSIRLVFGHERQTYFKLVVNIIATAAVGAAFTLAFSIMEELGWRGYFQPLLIERLNIPWGMVIGGVLWSVMYIPAILKGYRFRRFPRLGAFVFMPIYLISLATITGWLFALSGGLWAPALFNASARVSGVISESVLGDAGESARVRVVWLWLWAVLAGLALTLWYAGL